MQLAIKTCCRGGVAESVWPSEAVGVLLSEAVWIGLQNSAEVDDKS